MTAPHPHHIHESTFDIDEARAILTARNDPGLTQWATNEWQLAQAGHHRARADLVAVAIAGQRTSLSRQHDSRDKTNTAAGPAYSPHHPHTHHNDPCRLQCPPPAQTDTGVSAW